MWRSALLLALLTLTGCTPAPSPLQHTADAPVPLAQAVLIAVLAGDQATLASLAADFVAREHARLAGA